MSSSVSVAIALAGGFAMILAASGTPLNVHDQVQAIRAQLTGATKDKTVVALQTPLFQNKTVVPPPADIVSLAWSNGAPVQA
jgi:hypothetical protein